MRVPPFAASQDDGFAGRWPLQSFPELGALPGAVPCARLHARQVLWEWHLSDLSESAGASVTITPDGSVQLTRGRWHAAIPAPG